MPTNQYEYANLADFTRLRFESICRNIISRNYNVRVESTGASRDGGKDLVFTDANGRLHYVECKTERKPIGEPKIKAFNDTCRQDGAKGIYISLSGFSSVAEEAAKARRIDLIDFGDLCRFGELESPHIYYFGDSKPRMRNGRGVRSLTLTNTGRSGSVISVKVDGFEEEVRLSGSEESVVTMAGGLHRLVVSTAKVSKEVDLDLKFDTRMAISPSRLGGDFEYIFSKS